LSRGRQDEVSWQDAWERARKTLDGVTRRRVRGSQSDVEIALLDWGGEGDLVLMHHANGFCGATLAPIASALRGRYRVVAIDARGHGDSTSVAPTGDPDPYAWKALAADLLAATHEILAIVERDRVELAIGHSFGGALMLDSARLEPGLFGKLLLCDPVIVEAVETGDEATRPRGPDLAVGARKRRHLFPTREEAFEHFRSRGIFADFTPEALALYVGEGIGPTPDGAFALKCRPEIEAAIFSSAALTDLSRGAEEISADVLFVHALRGNFLRQRYDDLASRIPSARVESFDLGHLFPMEEPERVLAIIDDLMTNP
jgi:pimeloyl-ACP methyl ester carboxylesterase